LSSPVSYDRHQVSSLAAAIDALRALDPTQLSARNVPVPFEHHSRTGGGFFDTDEVSLLLSCTGIESARTLEELIEMRRNVLAS
jgi:hypothetical protein